MWLGNIHKVDELVRIQGKRTGLYEEKLRNYKDERNDVAWRSHISTNQHIRHYMYRLMIYHGIDTISRDSRWGTEWIRANCALRVRLLRRSRDGEGFAQPRCRPQHEVHRRLHCFSRRLLVWRDENSSSTARCGRRPGHSWLLEDDPSVSDYYYLSSSPPISSRRDEVRLRDSFFYESLIGLI